MPTPILWEFYQDQGLRWFWRRLLTNSSVDAKSEAFPDYGRCVSDAIRNGFDPSKQDYSNSSGNYTTHYRRNKPPDRHNRSS